MKISEYLIKDLNNINIEIMKLKHIDIDFKKGYEKVQKEQDEIDMRIFELEEQREIINRKMKESTGLI